MSKEKKSNFDSPFILRWKPDYKYQDVKMSKHFLDNFKSTESSITDKEAYRVTLASLRGELASGSGSLTTGSYSIQPGENYDPDFDFSYLNRPDLTIVDLDNFIADKRAMLESLDSNIAEQVKEQLKLAEQKQKELKLKNSNDTETTDE